MADLAARVDLVGARRPESFLDLMAELPFVDGARAEDGTLLVEVRDPRGDNPELVWLYDALSLNDVYSSPWFSAIYILLFSSLVGCVVPRLDRVGVGTAGSGAGLWTVPGRRNQCSATVTPIYM